MYAVLIVLERGLKGYLRDYEKSEVLAVVEQHGGPSVRPDRSQSVMEKRSTDNALYVAS